jgi:DNA anti-recombination protein RmuC
METAIERLQRESLELRRASDDFRIRATEIVSRVEARVATSRERMAQSLALITRSRIRGFRRGAVDN